MRFSIFVLLAIIYAWGSFGGTLEVIDFDNQCLIWSNDNHGCTDILHPLARSTEVTVQVGIYLVGKSA
jgi:hypothetical protein